MAKPRISVGSYYHVPTMVLGLPFSKMKVSHKVLAHSVPFY
jgi:hypothetical protein